MQSVGFVRVFHPEEGWGVIDSSEVPGGCWVHFSAIQMDGYRALHQGQRVVFEAEPADQDGYAYRAVHVQVEPATRAAKAK
ncbi:cold shock domain-containing protein [Dactylosporangium aurantiacum]|uniref:Cold shock domain-containing protein n=1 Tax=Dactylosporangium aurantiacum TaxID=35754 RepID=A0A9Q9IDD5_9ACTN|nr:cold shock domain-containing protein [Dactylosporangium aurantiacum]MDG6107476.1 cold shock domain-containing protein [Dactylosporangium aurantiacum]UWZ54269.1 cold shock domain-containing protein [Dactylosporangium aurantiacum]